MQQKKSENRRRPQTAPMVLRTKGVVNAALADQEREMKLPQFETHLKKFIHGGRIMSVIKQSKDNRQYDQVDNFAPSNESSTSSVNSSDGQRVRFKVRVHRILTFESKGLSDEP